MTTQRYSCFLFALVLNLLGISALLVPAASLSAQEFSKKIVREFFISPTGTTAVYNKYGDIKVHTWANKLVKMDITLLVKAADSRAAERLLERIKINFLHTPDYVKAETIVESAPYLGVFLFDSGMPDYKIHYEVWLPAENRLDVKNRYGDIYVSHLKGRLLAELRYGSLYGEDLGGDADLSIGYGKATLSQIRNLTGYVSYSDLLAKRAIEVSMDTRYSDIRILQASQVRIVSKYDKLRFDSVEDLRIQTRYSELKARQVGSLSLSAQYTDIHLERLYRALDADLSYGKIALDALGRHFSEARIQGKYTDVNITTEPGTAFRLDAQGKHTALRAKNLSAYSRTETPGGQVRLSGFHGDAQAPRIITTRLQYGDFLIK